MFELDKEYKQWTLKRILRHVIYWGFWIGFYCVLNGAQLGEYLAPLVLESIIMSVKLPYVYFVAYVLMPGFVPGKQYLKLFIGMVITAFIASYFISLLYCYFPNEMGKDYSMQNFGKLVYRGLDLLYIASFVVVIKLVQAYSRQKTLNAELIEDKIKAELQMLKNQLQPHFLFNTLNNIYSLVISEDKKAGGAVLKLSDILSYMLYECNVEKVSVEKEISLISNYIELEKIRYGNRLDLSFSVDGDTSGKEIPPLLLIPFVENAFKHGMAKSEKPSWIRIHLNLSEGELKFMVENECSGLTEEAYSNLKSGIGIKNVSKRLELLYPGRYFIRISKEESYLINLKIEL